MGYAQHIGRVGALAVALGVGSAITFPHTAVADTETGQTTTSVSRDSSPTSDTDTSTETDGVTSTTESTGAQTTTSPDDEDEPATEDPLEDLDAELSADPDIELPADPDVDAELPSDPDLEVPAEVPTDTESEESPPEAETPTASGDGPVLGGDPDENATQPHLPPSSPTTTLTPDAEPSEPEVVSTLSTQRNATTLAASATTPPHLPQASVTVTAPPPPPAPLRQIVRALVVGVLGIFDFNPAPAPGVPKNPFLEAIWGLYRRIESFVWNERPTITTAQIVGTSFTGDGKLAVILDVDFDDANGDPLTYTTTDGTQGTLTANTDGTYTYYTDADSTGTDAVTITAADTAFHFHGLGRLFGGGHTTTATLAITLTETPNTAPTVATPIPDQTATEDTGFTYQVPAATFGDAEADTLTYSTGTLPAWLTFNAATRTFTGTPTNTDVGTVAVVVTATDPSGASVTDTFSLAVANVNDAPTVANPIPDQTATQGTGFTYTLPANTFGDIDAGDTLTYTTGALPSWLTFSPTTRTFTGTPTNTDVGTVSVTVTATDPSGASVTDSLSLAVANVNDAPTVANPIPDQTATQGTGFTYTLPANTFGDIDAGDTLTYTTGTLPAWLSFNATTRTFTGTPTNAAVGTVAITVTATDESGLSVTDTFALAVANVNDAPTVRNPIPDQTATQGTGFTYTLPGNTFRDIDTGDTLTYTTGTLPSWLSFNATTRTFTGTPTNAAVGTVAIIVTATDESGLSVTDTFALAVANVNDAPTVANPIPGQTATQDAGFTYTLPANTFGDIDTGDTLTYTTNTLPSWLTFNATTRTFTGTPTNTDVGTVSVTVTATDASGASVTDTFALAVANVNDAPTVANPIPDQTATQGTGFSYTLPANTFGDIDAGDTLTYSTGTLPSWLTFNPATRTFTGTPTNTNVGTVTVTVTAADQAGQSVTDTFTATVTPTNDAPVIYSVTSTPGTGNTWVVTVITHDPDGDPVTVGLTADDPTRVSVTTNTNGTYTVTVTDTSWAAAHPGAQISITATVTDGTADSVTHTEAIGTVNNAVAFGRNPQGQNTIPALPAGITYTQVAANEYHTVLLRSDGTAIAVGRNSEGQNDIPELPAGITYTQVAAGAFHTVLLRSDGTAIAIGDDSFYGQIDIPELPAGITYTQVAAGDVHTVLLRSDGTAIAVGRNFEGQTTIPAPPAGITYTQVAAGYYHTVLLRSDGTAIAAGSNGLGQTTIPAPPAGITYTQVAAGNYHTVLLRSDGTAIAAGSNFYGQTTIPAPPAGITYTQVAAGVVHTVLLRSDGTAIAVGRNSEGQSTIPALPAGVIYTQVAPGALHTVLLTGVASTTAL
ncbi:putative Ig domain-containing protein [Mycolicibacterium aurum]|uniref:putative Ig domain-containing protein n=1 Tax=Mycolicibacterium aurum TaxID=1791 RepID=UPI00069F3D98|nr:putative Ig domain-containing protein [Mycolicibacterium aurum]